MNRLSIVPDCFFHDRQIERLIRDAIGHGQKTYDELDELDKDALTARAIHLLGGDCEVFDDANIRAALITYMENPSEHYDFAETVRKSAIDRYANYFNAMFDDMIEVIQSEIDSEERYNRGMRRHVDRINGEVIWA